MELFILFGCVTGVVLGIVLYNLAKRPDWTRRKLSALVDRFKR